MSARSRVFTYAEFKELANDEGYLSRGQLINTTWRWAVLGIKGQQTAAQAKPLEATLTEKQLQAALAVGHGYFPRMSDEQWELFADIAPKLIAS